MSIGTCHFCDSDYVVVVNGTAACQQHTHNAMTLVCDVESILREAMDQASTVPDHLPDNDESRGHGSVR